MAELLLRDGDPVTSSSPSPSDPPEGEEGDHPRRGGGVDRTLVTRAERPAEPRAVARFTELLLYGTQEGGAR